MAYEWRFWHGDRVLQIESASHEKNPRFLSFPEIQLLILAERQHCNFSHDRLNILPIFVIGCYKLFVRQIVGNRISIKPLKLRVVPADVDQWELSLGCLSYQHDLPIYLFRLVRISSQANMLTSSIDSVLELQFL